MADAKIVIDVKRTFGYKLVLFCLKHIKNECVVKLISDITVIKAYNNGKVILKLKAKDIFGNI